MTLIDELLILIDDSPDLEKDSLVEYLPEQSKQAIFSTLGRLVKKRMIKDGKITAIGREYLDSTLLFLKRKDGEFWKENWKLLFFNIPEKERGKRDTWRKFLKNHGFGILREGVWIIPPDCEEKIGELANKLKISSNIFAISTDLGKHPNIDNIILNSWDWETIKKEYQDFTKETDRELKKIKKQDSLASFLAKRMVFRYSQILRSEPVLPSELSPSASFSAIAHDLYQKIRPHCYN